ncbi:hypothetical protein ES707_06083 [subsurface metagenome]
MLRQGEGRARRDQPFDRRIVGQGEKQGHVFQDPGLLEAVDEKAGHIVLDTHGGEHHGETALLAPDLGLPGNLGGQGIVGQPVAREDGQLLATDQGVHTVDRRDAGLDEIAGILPGRGIDRPAVYVQLHLPRRGRTAVDGLTQTVEHPPEHPFADLNGMGLPPKTDMGLRHGQPRGPGKDLEHHDFRGGVQYDAQTGLPFGIHALRQVTVADGVCVADEHQGSFDAVHPDVLPTGQQALLGGFQISRGTSILHRSPPADRENVPAGRPACPGHPDLRYQ